MIEMTEELAFKMFEKYIQAWNNRDTKSLDQMFSMDVFLMDWDVAVQGKESVIGANVQIWESVPDIHIEILSMAFNPKTQKVFGQITVKSEKENLDLKVIDVVKFNNQKIVKVDAYKQ
jgi:hypothetical protein